MKLVMDAVACPILGDDFWWEMKQTTSSSLPAVTRNGSDLSSVVAV